MSNAYPYCALFSFTEERIRRHLRLMDMQAGDHQWSQRLRESIMNPYLKELVEVFYSQLQAKPEFNEIMQRGGFDVGALKKTQSHYLDTLGVQFDSPGYFDARLKIGFIHDRVGVPLSLYQSAYRILQDTLMNRILQVEEDRSLVQSLHGFVLRITSLDMSLAIAAYHHSQVDALEHSIDRMRREQLRLLERASTDALTELPNRETVRKELARDLTSLESPCKGVHVIMADLDNFKNINDKYGHLTGDAVLRDVSARLRACLRDSDSVGRYGGEEFIIVLRNKDNCSALQVAERIRNHVAGNPVSINGHSIAVTLSQGLADGRAGDQVDELIDRADQALYAAKHAGRNCIRTHDELARD